MKPQIRWSLKYVTCIHTNSFETGNSRKGCIIKKQIMSLSFASLPLSSPFSFLSSPLPIKLF